MAGTDKNYQSYLKLDTSSFFNKWVAIVDGEVVAADESFKKTFTTAKELFPKKRPFISKIPGNKAMIL